jgi:hypothetical protein
MKYNLASAGASVCVWRQAEGMDIFLHVYECICLETFGCVIYGLVPERLA